MIIPLFRELDTAGRELPIYLYYQYVMRYGRVRPR